MDLVPLIIFIFYSMVGAVVRALFGIYKAYTSLSTFNLNLKRIGFEIIASVIFGTFATAILQEIVIIELSATATALLSGFLGADLLNLILKRYGISKFEVRAVEVERIRKVSKKSSSREPPKGTKKKTL